MRREDPYVHVGILRCVGRRDGVRARRHAIKLEVCRVRLSDNVDGMRRMLVLVFMLRHRCRRCRCSCFADCRGGFGERGMLGGGEGGVERALAERLREGAGVLFGCCAECGHGHGHGYCWLVVGCGSWAGKRSGCGVAYYK
jgi:hypothetical protein